MLTDEFRALCEAEAPRLALSGQDFEEDGKQAVFTAERGQLKLETVFRYGSFGNVKNVLYCRLYPNRSNAVYYLLPEAFAELDIPEYRSVFFPMIENKERLAACFAQLMRILYEHLPRLEEAALCGLLPWAREVTDADSLERRMVFADSPMLSRDPFVIYDYTLAPQYGALLAGDLPRALKVFARAQRKGNLGKFQTGLYGFLRENGEGFEPMPEECNAVKALRSTKKSDALLGAASILVTFAAFSALFLIIKLIFDAFFTRGACAVFGMPWYACLLFAALPALFTAIALRRRLARGLMPKYAAKYNEFDAVLNSEKVNRLAKAFAAIAVGFAAAVFIICSVAAVRVFPDRLDAPRDGDMFRREEYAFEDISAVYHISARYNDDGERIERGSYVLYMKDGRALDLYGSASEKQTEQKLLPLFEGIEPTALDSDRDLP